MTFLTVGFLKAGFLTGGVGFAIELAVPVSLSTALEESADLEVALEGVLAKKL